MRLAHLVAVSAIALSLTPALGPAPAAAQQAQVPAAFPCAGSVNLVRISEIKPGMMQKFLDAVAAQKAWYKNAGLPDEIAVMRIMERDPAGKSWSLSETQAITTHIEPSARTGGPAHDAAWDAFVAMYTASSTIKNSYLTCMF
jgi:hypothetical protein